MADISPAPDPLDDPLDHAIAQIEAERRQVGDSARLRGRLGCALLVRFERDVNPEDLAESIRLLRSALQAGHAADPRLDWTICLGLALSYRGEASGERREWDVAIDAMREVVRVLPPSSREADEALTELGLLHWRGFLALDSRCDHAETAWQELMRTLAELRAASAGESDYLVMVSGLALLERYERRQTLGDLRRAAQLLLPVLPKLGGAEPYVALAWTALSRACLEAHFRDDTDEAATWLDRAVRAAARATLLSPPDEPEAALCYRLEADCREARWDATGAQRIDLDRAIACLQRLWERGERDRGSAVRLGMLLAQRGDLDECVADLGRAIELLSDLPAPNDDTDDEDALLCHDALAVATARRADLVAHARRLGWLG